MAAALRREGFRINHKKLYRLMKEASLLSSTRPSRLSKRLLAPRGAVEATRPRTNGASGSICKWTSNMSIFTASNAGRIC
jgi:hypothetical protein